MRNFLQIIVLFIISFSLCCCKNEKPEPQKKISEKPKSTEKKESYKVCLDKDSIKDIRLGNYAYKLKITPNLSQPKHNMEYELLLIRDKKKANNGNLKLNDTVINILINKKNIAALADNQQKDRINIDNFHLMSTRYNYSRSSEIHFEVVMYSIKDSLFCNADYHFNYETGKYRFGIYKEQETKIKALKKYNNFKCH
ncbi:hypothetical protein [Cellulophaga baltica]|uniref:Lipoprotein n=1 Tax=Cellulophaga baltica 18 TaxID=1348584 RepID=A0AAU8RGX0_9FLAO|nr:hypothetical protein [Cellulophaga baltica]AIZ42351.1 hypothetical protein M666_12615 [Cellulophaga baltica 18]